MRLFGGVLVLAALSLVACGGSGSGGGPVVAPVSSGAATPSVAAPEPSSSEPGTSEALDAASEIEAETGARPPVVFPAMFADGPPKSLPEEIEGFVIEDPSYLPAASRAEYYPVGDANLDGFDLHVYTDDLRFNTLDGTTEITVEQHSVCGMSRTGTPHCVAFAEDGAVVLVYFGDEGSMSFEALDGHLAEVLEFFRGL